MESKYPFPPSLPSFFPLISSFMHSLVQQDLLALYCVNDAVRQWEMRLTQFQPSGGYSLGQLQRRCTDQRRAEAELETSNRTSGTVYVTVGVGCAGGGQGNYTGPGPEARACMRHAWLVEARANALYVKRRARVAVTCGPSSGVWASFSEPWTH